MTKGIMAMELTHMLDELKKSSIDDLDLYDIIYFLNTHGSDYDGSDFKSLINHMERSFNNFEETNDLVTYVFVDTEKKEIFTMTFRVIVSERKKINIVKEFELKQI